MINIYTGFEYHIHKILGKRAVKELNIIPDDIGFISFTCALPTKELNLWQINVTIETAEDNFLQRTYYSQEPIRHGFKVTWKNLLKENF